jgi:hypothetical protein
MAVNVIRNADRPELWHDTATITRELWREYNKRGEVCRCWVVSATDAISPGTRPCATRGAPRTQPWAFAGVGTSGTARRTGRAP